MDTTNHFALLKKRSEPWMLSPDPLLQAHHVTITSAACTEVRCIVTGTRVQLVWAFRSPHGTPYFPAWDSANGNETSKTNTKGLKDKRLYSRFKLHKPTTMFMEETDLIEISLQTYTVEFILFSLHELTAGAGRG